MTLKKRLAAAAVSVTLLLGCFAACGSDSGDKQVVNILSANYEEQIAVQRKYLQSLYPDAEINMTYMSSGKLAAKLQAEGKDTETDIVLSLSSGFANTLKDAGLLAKYDTDTEYKAQYADPDGIVLPNGVWAGAMLVNTQELERLGLPEPSSYADLVNPVYKDHIVMASPSSSSTGYFFLYGLIELFGEEKAWEYFDALNENIMLYAESGSAPSAMVEKGEAVIGLGIDYEGMKMASDGKPVKVIFAEEGVPYDYDTALLVNRSEGPTEFAQEIMKTITSPEGNDVFNNYNISVIEGVEDKGEYPENISFINMEGIGDPDVKAELSEKWGARYE